ncbi:MAG: asparagine synthetase B family protein, partial [Phycisphaerales bacterium JB041]
MCGIAGILRTWKPGEAPPDPRDAIPEAWLDILDDSIKHRGPDGQGRFRQRVTRPDGTTIDVALVHRRLSIIDHADGHQPMVIGSAIEPLAQARGHAETSLPHPTPPLLSREGHPYQPLTNHTCPKCGPGLTAVVFNGCIYNHRELRAELEAAGHTFHTDHSDTEVLLHGWREWGEHLTEHLEGMFAFAIFDSRTGTLIESRDVAGEKPLYASVRADRASYVFCSSPAGILKLGDRLPLDRDTTEPGIIGHANHIKHHLPMWIDAGYDWEMPVRGFEEIPPSTTWGALPVMQLAGAAPAWAPLSTPRNTEPFADIDELERLLDESTRVRLEADVPVGCFLSGGVDSSLIAAFAKRHRPDIRSFTVRMPQDTFDESPYAERAARHLGLNHATLDCQADPASDLVRLIHQLGLPFGDSSLLPTSWLSAAARQTATVAISGD